MSISKQHQQKTNDSSGAVSLWRTSLPTILTVVLILLIIANGTLYFTRIDLTEDNVYSISEVSRNLFLEIEDQVHISYYLSNRLRSRAAEVDQISDLLYQYAAFSRGRITVEVTDPTELGITQDVEAAGVVPRQIQVIEDDQQSIAVVYSGIVISYLDRSETLPFIIEPSALEYELSSAIRALIRDSERILSVLVGNDRESLDQNYPFIREQLGQLYEIKSVLPGEPVSSQSSALVVLGAGALTEDDVYYIDQFIMSGGKTLFAIDAVKVNADLSFFAFPIGDAPLFDALERYGLTIEQSLIADTYNLRIPIQRQTGGSVVIQQLSDYPYWIALLGGGANLDHPITARFPGVDLFWASPITLNNPDDPRVTPLLYSSPNSWIVPGPSFSTNPQEAQGVLALPDAETTGEHLVGVIVEGQIDSAFDGLPETVREETPDLAYSPRTDQGSIIVISDADFPSLLSQFTQSFHNFTFFQDLVGWLVNDDDLLTIRTRANRDVRLNALLPEQKVRVGQFAMLVNVFVVPFALALFGIIRALLRRKSEALSIATAITGAKARAGKQPVRIKAKSTPKDTDRGKES